jgi:UDP-N-acetylmuramate--alanine ligase
VDFKQINTVYFLGVGGIGMSALARYFNQMGKRVMGYDKTETVLTKALETEGVQVHYTDLGPNIVDQLGQSETLVVYTPAISTKMAEFEALRLAGFHIVKRAEVLGIISKSFETFAVAGTHGKTTTSSILAHVLYQTPEKCNAFIGGISSNYNSNCLIAPDAKRIVVEADEFDRSFLQLVPNYAIITTTDADHLDIYGDALSMKKSFADFVGKINTSGRLFVQADIDLKDLTVPKELATRTYAFSQKADWVGKNLTYRDGKMYFDIEHESQQYNAVEFGLPGQHNAENALAVFGLLMEIGIAEKAIRAAFSSYLGVKRRFDYHVRRDDLVIIDDYAHHPSELKALFGSVKLIYPTKKITVVFQPHLYSRTRDFMDEFAEELSAIDEVYLLDIYPAREEAIPGITSEALLHLVGSTHRFLATKESIVLDLQQNEHEVILIVGAGDIDTCVSPIVKAYTA